MPPARRPDDIIDELASELMAPRPESEPSLTMCEQLAGELTTASGSLAPYAAQVDHLSKSLKAIRAKSCPDVAAELDRMRNDVAEMQDLLERSKSVAVSEPPGQVWDEESIEILTEFVQEIDDGLAEVDDILLKAEQTGATAEQVNAVFRVFHTIKGVANFLELSEIGKLSHTTETVLDKARKGDVALEGPVLDVVFDSTNMMRSMGEDLRQAIEQQRAPKKQSGLETLVMRLDAAVEGGEVAAPAPLPPAPASEPEPVAAPDASPERGAEPEPAVVASEPEPEPVVAPAPAPEPAPPAVVPIPEPEPPPPAVVAPAPAPAPAPPAPAPAPPAPASAPRRSPAATETKAFREVVKVDLERVDNLVSLIGELVIVEAMVVNSPELSAITSHGLRKHLSQMSKITRDLQDIGTRMRMVPVRGVFQKMSRMVRDLSRKNGKNITAELFGESTEVDRSMVEQIGDPLIHMIRNAVDHGIEDGPSRVSAGKPNQGTITLRAFHQGGSVVIEVSDDGRGLNPYAILAKAKERGLIREDEQLTESQIYDLVFAPGFSTAAQVTAISGRGVGMDVVRRKIEAIRGRVTIDSVPGQGAKFTMVLPLTLAIIDGMLITCGTERYIIPTLSVVESLKPEDSMIFTITGKGELVSLRGETFPLFRLHRLFDISDAIKDPTQALVVVIESRGKKLGLLVDDVLTQQQVVIKSLEDGLPNTRYLSGAAIMSDGRVGLILNTDEISSLLSRNTFRSHEDSPSVAEAGAF